MFGALSFTAPLMLLALLSLPLVWLLLRATPPAPKREAFPAFIILRQLTTSEETPDRTPWPLLLLRLLLAALIIIALAGPILNAPTPAPGAGPLALVIDDSWAAGDGWRLRQNAIREAAADAEQNNRTLFIITTARERSPSVVEPLTPEIARNRADSLSPRPYRVDRLAAIEKIEAIDRFRNDASLEIRWLSDGAAGENDQAYAEALRERGDVVIYADANAPKPILRPLGSTPNGPLFQLERLSAAGEWAGAVTATARDGRELARVDLTLADGEATQRFEIELPLALRNDLAAVRIENAASAGAVHLVDARDRRALVGLIEETANRGNDLLTGGHYLRQALGPYADFQEGPLEEILDSDVSVIVLNDIGAIRPSQADDLAAWVESGGVLIRFAGPVLAEAAQDRIPPLLPVRLRGGGRAFGGALTWETPQRLDRFPADSPFADLIAPSDALVRRQVLAEPGGDTTNKTWARLEDGTPLVTGARQGDGVIAMFHVTATPDWSDLPISGVFIEMLRRLTFLSTLGPEGADDGAEARFPPLRLADGFGRLRRPGDNDPSLSVQELSDRAGPDRRPGYYGAPEAPLALNAVRADTPYEPLRVSGVITLPFAAEPPRALAPFLFAAALALLLLDGLVTLVLAGKLRLGRIGGRSAASTAVIALVISLAAAPIYQNAAAQPLDRPVPADIADATLTTRLAYVETGDPALDRLSAQGLAGLSRELHRRTALEPGPPVSVNPDTDDLSVYPFLYWPIAPGADEPSEAALANIENFLRFGGMILFDTRDDERAVGAGSTPEAQALQRTLRQLNIPPLTPVTDEHVLTRSFYLLPDLQGRLRNNPVWVQADTSGANDGVTPIIIGGRDWAAAWASDQFGRPVRPIAGGDRARELSYRAGINIVMVAFTGNYKSDQVHTPILLERMGR